MQRVTMVLAWLVEALGRYPIEDGLALYREIEFPRETDRIGQIGQIGSTGASEHRRDQDEALRLAS